MASPNSATSPSRSGAPTRQGKARPSANDTCGTAPEELDGHDEAGGRGAPGDGEQRASGDRTSGAGRGPGNGPPAPAPRRAAAVPVTRSRAASGRRRRCAGSGTSTSSSRPSRGSATGRSGAARDPRRREGVLIGGRGGELDAAPAATAACPPGGPRGRRARPSTSASSWASVGARPRRARRCGATEQRRAPRRGHAAPGLDRVEGRTRLQLPVARRPRPAPRSSGPARARPRRAPTRGARDRGPRRARRSPPGCAPARACAGPARRRGACACARSARPPRPPRRSGGRRTPPPSSAGSVHEQDREPGQHRGQPTQRGEELRARAEAEQDQERRRDRDRAAGQVEGREPAQDDAGAERERGQERLPAAPEHRQGHRRDQQGAGADRARPDVSGPSVIATPITRARRRGRIDPQAALSSHRPGCYSAGRAPSSRGGDSALPLDEAGGRTRRLRSADASATASAAARSAS